MMRITQKMEQYRLQHGDFASFPGDQCGVFFMPGPCGMPLRVIVSDGIDPDGAGWEHVSVSTNGRRPPNWEEMCFIKERFWPPEDCVVQFHPPAIAYVNNVSNCLHLWRHRTLPFPRPPEELVGIKALGVLS